VTGNVTVGNWKTVSARLLRKSMNRLVALSDDSRPQYLLTRLNLVDNASRFSGLVIVCLFRCFGQYVYLHT